MPLVRLGSTSEPAVDKLLGHGSYKLSFKSYINYTFQPFCICECFTQSTFNYSQAMAFPVDSIAHMLSLLEIRVHCSLDVNSVT